MERPLARTETAAGLEEQRHWLRGRSAVGRAAARAGFALRRLTAPWRGLPDFLIVGAARCGTTSLYHDLTSHPGVAGALRKEVGFFDRRWRLGLGHYRAHFPLRRRGRQVGEATPCYLFDPHAPRRIAGVLPRAKLIVLLRNPVDRAYSHFCVNVRDGRDRGTFERAFEREPDRLAGELERMLVEPSYFSYRRWSLSYLSRGYYAEQLERWLQHVERTRLLVLPSEALFADPERYFRRVTDFLDLPPWQPERPAHRAAVPKAPLLAVTRTRLLAHFAPHNERLFALLGERWAWDR